MNEGTPIHTTIAGKVVWAGSNGPWGNLVVIENNGYQIWLAHLNGIEVTEGQILNYGDVVGLSGNTGNSTGALCIMGSCKRQGKKVLHGSTHNPSLPSMNTSTLDVLINQ